MTTQLPSTRPPRAPPGAEDGVGAAGEGAGAGEEPLEVAAEEEEEKVRYVILSFWSMVYKCTHSAFILICIG